MTDMYTRILATIGGSPWSDTALTYAIDLARRLGVDLHILTGLVMPGSQAQASPGPPNGQAQSDMEKAAWDLLNEAAQEARQAGVTVVTHVAWGAIPTAILQTATTEGCDLIVLGTRRRTSAERQELGHIAHTVAANAPQSVLVVKRPLARRALLGRRILVAAGHSSWSKYAVEHAIGLAQVLGLEVVVLHVEHQSQPDDETEIEGKQLVADAEAWSAAAGIAYEGVFASGPVPEAILDTAAQKHCRAIILGTRSVSGWDRLALGSIVNAVAARATLPVLIVKPDLSV
jgi:nucleotide-binding universal stress UspA family protein